jgi:phosphohistidine phosphatase
MMLYLVQHAEAKREDEDPLRSLTETGAQDVRRVAVHLSKKNISLDRALHSAKLRARQTAEILREYLKPVHGAAETDALAPMDDPRIWADRITAGQENLMLVGHLPHLERLAALLLCGDPSKRVVAFTMAAVVAIERSDDGTWSLRWLITPELTS